MATVKISDTLKIRLAVFAKRHGETAETIAERAISSYLRETPVLTARETPAQLPQSLARFAASVQRAANASTEAQRFGDRKVFISEVAKNLGVSRSELPAFKKKLLEARRAGQIQLARADLVEAMDPHQVDNSATVDNTDWGSEEYHFVRV